MLELGLKFTAAYLLGSLLGSLVVGRLRGGVDIRRLGSANAGATNALRTQGKVFALFVMLIDVGKGILAVLVIPGLSIPGVGIDPAVNRDLVLYGVAFAVILGHVYPLWYGFRGGKGGATAAGLLFVIAPLVAPFVIVIWITIVFVTRFVGLATMSATVAATVIVAWQRLPEDQAIVIFSACVAALMIFTHRANIVRMINGTENRMGQRSGSA